MQGNIGYVDHYPGALSLQPIGGLLITQLILALSTENNNCS